MANKESLDDAQTKFVRTFGEAVGEVDPILKLQRMSMSELTLAYDYLLGILKQREALIKDRIADSLKRYGKEERVLFDSKDFRLEQETMPDLLNNILRYDANAIDRILGINEQIANMELRKNIPPEEKMYQWFTDTASFNLKPNFNEVQLMYADTTKLDRYRDHFWHDEKLSKSEHRRFGKAPSPFKKEMLNQIKEEVKKAEQEYETPFDQIYHKEKKLVQDVIRAQLAIKELEERLPNPAANRLYDPAHVDTDPQYGDMFASLLPKHRLMGKNEVAANQESDSFKYDEVASQTIEDMIASGQISREEFDTF